MNNAQPYLVILGFLLLNGCTYQRNCEVDLGVIKTQPTVVGRDSTNYVNLLALEVNLVKDLPEDEWGIRFTIPSDTLSHLEDTAYHSIVIYDFLALKQGWKIRRLEIERVIDSETYLYTRVKKDISRSVQCHKIKREIDMVLIHPFRYFRHIDGYRACSGGVSVDINIYGENFIISRSYPCWDMNLETEELTRILDLKNEFDKMIL